MDLDKDVPYSWEKRNSRNSRDVESLSAISIFFAVLGAILAAWVIREVYIQWQMQKTLQVMNAQFNVITKKSQMDTKRLFEQQTRMRIEAEEKAKTLKANQARINNEMMAEKARRIQEEARKEEAWKAFYKPVENCSDGKSESIVLCGNDYMRARKRFEQEWELGLKSN